jgi:hypothetical protein
MKLKHFIKRKVYTRDNSSLDKGKYAGVLVKDLDTQYIAYALEGFFLSDGMRYVLSQELVSRCKMQGFI